MTKEEKIFEQVYDFIEDCYDDGLIITMWNEYCDQTNDYENMIRPMNEIDDYFCGMSATDILNGVADDFDINDDYFRESIWGVESTSSYLDFVDIEELAQYISDYEKNLGSEEVQEIIDSCEDDEEEEEEEFGA